eukprot:jgi/Tetstr1/456904/TSEL_043574.t1
MRACEQLLPIPDSWLSCLNAFAAARCCTPITRLFLRSRLFSSLRRQAAPNNTVTRGRGELGLRCRGAARGVGESRPRR